MNKIAPPTPPARHTVLVVDDDARVRQMLALNHVLLNKDSAMDILSDIVSPTLAPVETQGAGRGQGVTLPGDRANGAAQAGCPADEVFAQAVIDDSNQELDWLWVYVQLTDAFQRRYCLERALAINPKSELARRELAKLLPRP